MSREELLQEIIEISRGIRQQEIDLGRQMEQERIIKLLEGQKVSLCTCGNCNAVNHLIELIKGEQK